MLAIWNYFATFDSLLLQSVISCTSAEEDIWFTDSSSTLAEQAC